LDVDHAYYYPAAVELGTRKTPPQAPMRKALAASHEVLLAAIKAAVLDGIRHALRP
jgi:hypothetical protein